MYTQQAVNRKRRKSVSNGRKAREGKYRRRKFWNVE
jgi:hypothetical protein